MASKDERWGVGKYPNNRRDDQWEVVDADGDGILITDHGDIAYCEEDVALRIVRDHNELLNVEIKKEGAVRELIAAAADARRAMMHPSGEQENWKAILENKAIVRIREALTSLGVREHE